MISSSLLGTAVSALAGAVAFNFNSRSPIATLASLTMERNCAGEAWRTLLASESDDLIVNDLILSSSLLCRLSLNKPLKESSARAERSASGGDT